MTNKVAVYAPDGTRELHTKANARDLVVGAGYSWHPNAPSQPAAFAPFVTMSAPSDKTQSQEVMDKVGGSLANAPAPGAAAAAAATYEAETPVLDADEAAEVEAIEADTAADDAPARGRGRRSRASAEA